MARAKPAASRFPPQSAVQIERNASPSSGTAHQAGTARFGTDPTRSVLDTNCKAHELDNLYLADTSFYPSIGSSSVHQMLERAPRMKSLR